jgi:hypothetical protein
LFNLGLETSKSVVIRHPSWLQPLRGSACYRFLEAIQKKVKRCWKRRDFNGMECADGHEKGSNGGN